MELILQSGLEHQQKAVGAVADVFNNVSFINPSSFFENPQITLPDATIAQNIIVVQEELHVCQEQRNNTTSSTLLNLDIKMETGTGKTYVYTNVIYELHKRFGINKFVIAVPSLPIKAGTQQFIADPYVQRHFKDTCGYGSSMALYTLNASKKKKGKQFFPSAVRGYVEGSFQNRNKIYVLLLADFSVVVRGNRRDLRDVFLAVHLDGHLGNLVDDSADGCVHAALDVHRVRACGDVLEAFAGDSLGEDRGGGGAVACGVARLARDFLGHLGAEVFIRVFQFDFLSDRDTVLGDVRGAEGLADHHVAALGTEGDLHGVRELVNAFHNAFAGSDIILQLFCHIKLLTLYISCCYKILGILENGENIALSHDQITLSVRCDFGAAVLAVQNLVADLDVHRDHFALVVLLARTYGDDLALHGLFLRVVGNVETALRFGFSFRRFDENSISQGFHFHSYLTSLFDNFQPRHAAFLHFARKYCKFRAKAFPDAFACVFRLF